MKSRILLLAAAAMVVGGAAPVLAQSAGETYREQQAAYQQQLEDYWAAREKYDRDVARYDWRTYRHYPRNWPSAYSRYSADGIYRVPARGLIDRRVEAANGSRIGTVFDIDVDATGRLRGVQVDMPGNRYVWIDGADLRYDPDTRTLYTFLTTAQVRDMSFRG